MSIKQLLKHRKKQKFVVLCNVKMNHSRNLNIFSVSHFLCLLRKIFPSCLCTLLRVHCTFADDECVPLLGRCVFIFSSTYYCLTSDIPFKITYLLKPWRFKNCTKSLEIQSFRKEIILVIWK